MTEFFLPMKRIPTATAQEKQHTVRGGKVVVYDPDAVKAASAKFLAALMPHRPPAPYTGAVRLVVRWCFPCGKSHRDGEYKTTRPDTDNMLKLFKDCMTKVGFWRDDAQVASELNEKFYAAITGVYVQVTPL